MPQARNKLPLHGWYVISLRPLGQHGGVRRAATAAGASVFAMSTLRLEALDAGENLRRAMRAPRVIVTSPAAVRYAAQQLVLRARAGQQWFATGAGTEAALRGHGITDVARPSHASDSEALLALVALKVNTGDCIGIITALGGRGLLAARLRERGATLAIAEVYRRQPRAIRPARLRAMQALPGASALLLTSAEAFSTLWDGLDAPARASLRGRPCVVASDRLEALARSLDFASVWRAADATPRSLVAALRDHAAQGWFR